MPLRDVDGRVLTWYKFAEEASHHCSTLWATLTTLQIAEKVAKETRPVCVEDCWFVQMHGGTLRGTLSKRSLERERRTSGGSTASCISSRTPPPTPMTPPKKSPTCAAAAPSIQQNSVVRACINPHHTVATDHATNLSHNQCANGCAQLCPHSKNAHGQMWRDGG